MSVSAASAKSLHQSMVKTKTVQAGFHLLHLIIEKVDTFPTYLIHVGIAIQHMQILGFAYCPQFNFSMILAKHLSYFVFAFSGPLFDRNYGPLNYTAYIVLVALALAFLVCIVVALIVGMVFGELLEHKLFLHGLRIVMEVAGGWLFVPLMHLFLGGMMCSGGSVLNFPSVQCSDVQRIVATVLGSVGVLIAFCIGLMMCLVFNLDVTSTHPLARAHGYVDLLLLIGKTVLTIFFHVLLTTGKSGAFAIIVVVVCVIWIGALVAILPYYHLRTTSLLTATITCTCVVSIINVLSGFGVEELGGVYTELNASVLMSFIPLSWYFGYCLASWRVNPECTNKLREFSEYGITPEHVAQSPFPRTLRMSEVNVVSASLRNLEKDLIQEIPIEGSSGPSAMPSSSSSAAAQAAPGLMGVVASAPGAVHKAEGHSSEFFLPYVRRVVFSTDPEVATRFLRFYTKATGELMTCSAAQLAFALRLYLHGLGYFKQSGYVSVSLGWFLYTYCNRTGAVVELLRDIENRRHVSLDYMVMFKAYRLEMTVKEALGYRDAAHLFALQRARQHHRQAIATTERFWAALLVEKSDLLSLILLNNQISQQRNSATKEYRLATSTSQEDRTTLYSFSSFVEDLYYDKDVAQELRNTVDDIELQKKNNMMGGATRKRLSRNHVEFDTIIAATQTDKVIRNAARDFQRNVFIALTYTSVVLVLAASAVMLALTVVNSKLITKNTRAIMEANNARASGFEAIFYTEKAGIYYVAHNCSASPAVCIADTSFIGILQNVSKSEMDMRIRQNLITYGQYGPAVNSKSQNFLVNGRLPVSFNPQGDIYYPGTFCCSSGTSVGLYAKLRAVLQGVPTPTVEWLAVTLTSGYITTMVNRLQNSQSYMHYMQFITDGGMEVVLDGMSSLTQAFAVDIREMRTNVFSGLIACLVFALLCIVSASVSVYVNAKWIVKYRVLMIHLFTYIPDAIVEKQREINERRLKVFEVSTEVRDGAEDLQLASQGSDNDSVEPVLGQGSGSGAPVSGSSPNKYNHNGNTADRRRPDDGSLISREAHAMFVAALLQTKPPRSCFKHGRTESSRIKMVHFRLAQGDLADRPRVRLLEPKVHVLGMEIVEEFEKNLVELDKEVSREKQEPRNSAHDNNTMREVDTNYRVHWSRIKERVASWNASTLMFKKLYNGMLMPGLLILAVVALAVVVVAFVKDAPTLSMEQTNIHEVTLLYGYVSRFARFDVQVSIFCNFFYADARNFIVNYAFKNSEYFSLTNHLQQQYDTAVYDAAVDMTALTTAILWPALSDMIYTVLAARAGYATGLFDMTTTPFLAAFQYGGEADTMTLAMSYPRVFAHVDEYAIPDLEDLPDDPNQFYLAVLPLHRRARFFDDMDDVQSTLANAATEMHARAVNDVTGVFDSMSSLTIAGLATTIVALVGVCAALWIERRRKLSTTLCVALIIALVTLVAATGLLGALLSDYVKKGVEITWSELALRTIGMYQMNLFLRLAYIENLVLHNNLASLEPIIVRAPTPITDTQNILLYGKTRLGDIVPLSTIAKLNSASWHVEQVAMFLAFAAYMKIANPAATVAECWPPPPYIQTYNFYKEDEYEHDQIYADDNPNLQYTIPEKDLLKTGPELLQMARFTLFGQRGAAYFFDYYDALDAAGAAIAAHGMSKAQKDFSTRKTIHICAIALLSAAVAPLLIAVVLPFGDFIRGVTQGYQTEMVNATVQATYSRILRSVFLCSCLQGILITLQFILAVIPLSFSSEGTKAAQYSTVRASELARSMAIAFNGKRSMDAQSIALASTVYASLLPSATAMLEAREYLYFRDSASRNSFCHVSTLNAEQRSIMFTALDSAGTTIDALYTQWVDTLKLLASFYPAVEVSVSNPASPAKNIFRITTAQYTQFADYYSTLESTYDIIMAAIHRSDDLLQSSFPGKFNEVLIPAAVIFAVIVLIMIGATFFILPIFFGATNRGEEETLLLLKSVPKVVHDAIPAIALFMDSNIIDEGAGGVIATATMSLNSTQFLSLWSDVDPSEDGLGCCDVLERSPFGAILADEYGTIVFANRHLLTLVGYPSLAGKSVTVLMEPEVAAMHGEFMRRYMRSGSPTGPKKTTVIVATAEGEPLQAVNVLAEAPTRSGQIYFLAEFHLCDTDENEKYVSAKRRQSRHKAEN